MKTIEYDAECDACGGTGLYRGIGERDGFAVVCHRCKGTGCRSVKINYTPFTVRKEDTHVKRVLEYNPGICVGINNEGLNLDSFGGIPYEKWLSGQGFPLGTEMRTYSCPAQWCQNTSNFTRGDWDECELGSFRGCSHYVKKSMCWERFDIEQNNLVDTP